MGANAQPLTHKDKVSSALTNSKSSYNEEEVMALLAKVGRREFQIIIRERHLNEGGIDEDTSMKEGWTKVKSKQAIRNEKSERSMATWKEKKIVIGELALGGGDLGRVLDMWEKRPLQK